MAAEKVYEFRKTQDKFMGLSFDTISSIGPNGSVIHYKPEKEGSLIVNNKEMYLLDSGCQYLFDFSCEAHTVTKQKMSLEMEQRM